MPDSTEFRSCQGNSPLPGIRRALAVLLLLLFSFCPRALALPPQAFVIENILLSTEGETLCVNMDFSVDDEDGLRDMLKDGAVLELKISFSLERERSWWTNKTVGKSEYTFNLRHDPLTREFIFYRQGEEDKAGSPVREKNLTRLLNATVRQLKLPLIKLSALMAEGMNQEYQAKVSFSLKHADVPPWLEKSAVFWSTQVIPEHTETLPFHY